MNYVGYLCNTCGKHAHMTDSDAGSERERRGLCKPCMDKISTCAHKNSYHFHCNAPKYCPDCEAYVE